VSVDYIKRLEQGRGHPSAGVLNSLSRALGLDRAAERLRHAALPTP
jgi:transcriptional regulator with XRE-family HTH domain